MQSAVTTSYTTVDPVDEYLEFLSSLRRIVPEVVGKNARWLGKLRAELRKPLLEVKTGSEIDRAVIAAARNRKTAYNGGHMDNGEGMEFRLGQAAVCFYRWLYNEGRISRNPYPQNSFRRPAQHEAHFLLDEQVRALLIYAERNLELRDHLILRLLLDTGLRISELCRLQLSDIDVEERVIHIQMTKVKRPKNPPFTPLTQRLVKQWLKERMVKSNFLFVGYKQGHITDKQIRLRFRKISAAVGFRVNPHALRHTAGTAWLEHAGQIPAMQILGHVDVKMTNHYTHLVGAKLRLIQERVMSKKDLDWSDATPSRLSATRLN